jgi:hypothetical protein
VRREELAAGVCGRELPGNVLDSVLANVQPKTIGVVGPGATWTVEAAVLVVHYEERAKALEWLPHPLEHPGDASRCTPPGRRMIILVSGVGAGPGRATAKRRLPGYRAEHPPFRVLFIFHSNAKIALLLLYFKRRQHWINVVL